MSVDVQQYKCPNCAAELRFNPKKQGFSCEYCESFFTPEECKAANEQMQAQAQQNTTQSYSGSSSQQTQTYAAPSGGDTSTSSGSSGSADSGCLTGDGNSPLFN